MFFIHSCLLLPVVSATFDLISFPLPEPTEENVQTTTDLNEFMFGRLEWIDKLPSLKVEGSGSGEDDFLENGETSGEAPFEASEVLSQDSTNSTLFSSSELEVLLTNSSEIFNISTSEVLSQDSTNSTLLSSSGFDVLPTNSSEIFNISTSEVLSQDSTNSTLLSSSGFDVLPTNSSELFNISTSEVLSQDSTNSTLFSSSGFGVLPTNSSELFNISTTDTLNQNSTNFTFLQTSATNFDFQPYLLFNQTSSDISRNSTEFTSNLTTTSSKASTQNPTNKTFLEPSSSESFDTNQLQLIQENVSDLTFSSSSSLKYFHLFFFTAVISFLFA